MTSVMRYPSLAQEVYVEAIPLTRDNMELIREWAGCQVFKENGTSIMTMLWPGRIKLVLPGEYIVKFSDGYIDTMPPNLFLHLFDFGRAAYIYKE